MRDEASNVGPSTNGLTRRDVLKRGLVFTGALVWSTPAIQSVGMSRALAQETSGCRIYCVKFEFSGIDLKGEWVPLGSNTEGNVLTCPPEGEDASLPEGFFEGFEIVSGDLTTGVRVRLPSSCTLYQREHFESEEMEIYNVAAKCGQGETKHSYGRLREFDIPGCGNGKDISHIELIIRCCF